MCMVSVIGDLYKDKWEPKPWFPDPYPYIQNEGITRAEFDALRKDVQDLKKLLEMAKDYDRKHGEPNCEIEEKMKLLRAVAKAVGINLDDALNPRTQAATTAPA